MAEWTLRFIDDTSQTEQSGDKLSSNINNVIGSGINQDATIKSGQKTQKTFSSEFENKTEQALISHYLVSPLNTVTGGLATPIYQSIKKVALGASGKVVAGGLLATGTIMLIQTGIEHFQKRMQAIETKVNELGNADNVLIRSGSVTTATYYSGNIFGIKSRTDRS